MNIVLLLAAVAIGIGIGAALWSGHGAYLVDIIVGALLLPVLRPEATFAIIVIQFAARRVPYVARSFANTFSVHPLLVPILLPGAMAEGRASAIEMVDTLVEAQPTSPRVMSRDEQMRRHTRKVRSLQARVQQFTAQTKEPAVTFVTTKQSETTPEPAAFVTLDEMKTIARLLHSGMSPSAACKELDGYTPARYKEYKAKVDAVKAAMDHTA